MDGKLPESMKQRIIAGHRVTKEEAQKLACADLNELAKAANDIRRHFCGDACDICSILNGKSGGCSEDCIYCAQSAHSRTVAPEYPVQSIVPHLSRIRECSAGRLAIVTAGRTLTEPELDLLCENYRILGKTCNTSLCASHGLLTESQLLRLKEAGVVRYHANLETSRRFFPHICTTHTYDDKLTVITAAQRAGLEVCSGGIFGIGETMEDRIDMARELRNLGIRSVPINILNPIPGTPLADAVPMTEDEIRRVVALYRFILPDSFLRIAGGRNLLPDKGKCLFSAGANAVISGDFLTTTGISISEDRAMLRSLGFEEETKK